MGNVFLSGLNLLGLALGLAMDAFAVSVVAGLTLPRVTSRHVFRMAFHFGLFQGFMPILGWLAGAKLNVYVAAFDHWLAFGLLSFIGGKMLLEAWAEERELARSDPTRGWMLVTLAVSTSIDAFAVGLSLALIGVSVWVPAIVIGAVALLCSGVGMVFSHLMYRRVSRVFRHVGPVAETLGGLTLIAIGIRVLIAHLK